MARDAPSIVACESATPTFRRRAPTISRKPGRSRRRRAKLDTQVGRCGRVPQLPCGWAGHERRGAGGRRDDRLLFGHVRSLLSIARLNIASSRMFESSRTTGHTASGCVLRFCSTCYQSFAETATSNRMSPQQSVAGLLSQYAFTYAPGIS